MGRRWGHLEHSSGQGAAESSAGERVISHADRTQRTQMKPSYWKRDVYPRGAECVLCVDCIVTVPSVCCVSTVCIY